MTNRLEHELKAAEQQFAKLERRLCQSPALMSGTVKAALEELYITLEELHMMAARLDEQNERLAGLRQNAEWKRGDDFGLFDYVSEPYRQIGRGSPSMNTQFRSQAAG